MTPERHAFLRDSLARIIYETATDDGAPKEDARAPWREEKWQEAAERCIKNVLAEVSMKPRVEPMPRAEET